MTTAAFSARLPHISKALEVIKTRYCAPPAYAPAAKVDGHMDCPRCKSRLAFTVLVSGLTSGRCVASGCISWAGQ